MRSKSKDAFVQRLQFAAAELEVAGGIVKCEGDESLLEKLHTLNERMQDCISHVSGDSKSAVRSSLPKWLDLVPCGHVEAAE